MTSFDQAEIKVQPADDIKIEDHSSDDSSLGKRS